VQHLRPLRDLAALILVVAPAVMLFVAVIRLIPSVDGDTFSTRAQASFDGFVNLTSIGLPLLAVLLATVVPPEHPKARLITTMALAQYAVAAFFGVLFGFLVGLISIAGFSVRLAFEELLQRGAWLAVFGVAAFAVFRIWRTLYNPPRPKAPPGMYGQPAQQYGPPQQQYGPPNGPQQYGPPPQQPYGQPAWNQPPPPPGRPGYPPVHPQSAPPAGYPQSAPPSAQPPGPFAPEPGHPQGPPPYAAYGAGPGHAGPPPVDPTQAMPQDRHEPTQMIDPGRAGYGEDPHRR
jgi:hypothetical protein